MSDQAQARFLTAGKLTSESGAIEIDLKTGSFTMKGPLGNAVIGDLEKGDVVARIDAASAVEPLHLGGVALYGELASKVREVQEILAAHGAGELKVVKDKVEGDKSFIVVDGQAFISQVVVDAGKFDVGMSIKTASLENGLKVMAGLISETKLCEELRKSIECISVDDDQSSAIRQVIRDELRPGGLLHRR